MSKKREKTAEECKASTSFETPRMITGIVSLVFLAAGIGVYVFGRSLASDSSFMDSVARFLTELRPTPAMLGRIDYKIGALSSVARYVGATLSLLAFLVFYLTLKGADVYSNASKKIQILSNFLGGRPGVVNILFILGSSVLMVIFATLLITTSGFLLGITVSRWHFLLAFFITVVLVWLFAKALFPDKKLKAFLVCLVFMAIAAFFSFIVSASVFDTAFDSQGYHQESMICMAEGWNPVYQSMIGDIQSKKLDEQVYITSKASAICAATIYKLTDSLEAGKAFNLLLIFSSFCLSFAAMLSLRKIPAQSAGFLSFLLAFNPVSIYQSMSYYVDGQMSSAIICSLSLLILHISRRDLLSLLVAGAALAILFSLKLTGMVYAILICAGFVLYAFFSAGSKSLIRTSIILGAFIILSVICISFNPIVTNHINHGHIFHPYYGNSAISIVNHGPAYIVGMNVFQKTISSVFSYSENFYAARLIEPNYKFPLSVSAQEMAVFANTDARVGGFGPLFGALIICSVAMVSICFVYEHRPAAYASLFIFCIMATIFLISEGWWARFVPHFYIVPFVAILLSFYYDKRGLMYLRRFMTAILIVNLFFVALPYCANQAMTTLSLSRQLKEMKETNSVLAVYFPFFSTSLGARLDKAGIEYVEVDAEYFKEQPKMVVADFSIMYYHEMK